MDKNRSLDRLKLSAIPSHSTGLWFNRIQPFVESALEGSDGKFTVYDIFLCLIHKEMQLWVITEQENDQLQAVIITQVITYPAKKVLLILIVAGVKFDEWSHTLPHFKLFAKDHACDAIEFYGRPGWEPKVKPLGFKKIDVMFSLPL